MQREDEEYKESLIGISEEMEKWEARLKVIKTQERYVKYHLSYYKRLLRNLKRLFSFKAFVRFLRFMFREVRR
ncbi:MAG: hypothetical protein DRN30_03690 [Thermoplasmata archaeon]|nr:hypothetical protein [Euryarchaeota archaeon]RLF65611.1 MAG: hypothetical protein DRN30_03690 [Thermoplasmata archaeon]